MNAHVNEMSAYFRDRLPMIFPPETRTFMSGLAIGIDVRDETYTTEIQTECMRRGLIVTTQNTQVMLLPALTIDRTVAAKGLDILDATTKKLH